MIVMAGTWSSLAPIPQARDDMAMAAMPGNRLLVMGGETNLGTARSQVQWLFPCFLQSFWGPDYFQSALCANHRTWAGAARFGVNGCSESDESVVTGLLGMSRSHKAGSSVSLETLASFLIDHAFALHCSKMWPILPG